MRIVFVRHGHPDYKLDCLTELGHRHAEAVAQRLTDEGIEAIYASPMGRAQQTAQHTAELLQLSVQSLPFMREIRFGSYEDVNTLPHRGNPWRVVPEMVSESKSIYRFDWQTEYPFCESRIVETVETITKGFDAWFSDLGYNREGDYYRVGSNTDRTVAIFSHAGSSTAVLSRLFNLPYIFLCSALSPRYTAITVVTLSDREGALVAPHLEIANDARHIRDLREESLVPSE